MAYSGGGNSGSRPGRSTQKMTSAKAAVDPLKTAGNARTGNRASGSVSPIRAVAPVDTAPSRAAQMRIARSPVARPAPPSTASQVGRAVATNVAARQVERAGRAGVNAVVSSAAGNMTALADTPQAGGGYYNPETGVRTYPVADSGAGVAATPLGDTAGQAADFSDPNSYGFSDGATGAGDAVEGASTSADAADAAAATGAGSTIGEAATARGPIIGAIAQAANSNPRGAAGTYFGGAVGSYFGGPWGSVAGSYIGARVVDPLIEEAGDAARDIGGQHLANSGDPYGQYFNGQDDSESATEVAIDTAGGTGLAFIRDEGLDHGAIGGGITSAVNKVDNVVKDIVQDVGGGCFITDATMAGLGVQDDEAEPLQVLRFFRDQVMMGTPQGQAMVQEYEDIAPLVVEAIQTRPDALEIFKQLFTKFIAPATEAVKASNYPLALQIYAAMIEAVTPFAQEVLDWDGEVEEVAEHAGQVAGSQQVAQQATGLRQFIGGQ